MNKKYAIVEKIKTTIFDILSVIVMVDYLMDIESKILLNMFQYNGNEIYVYMVIISVLVRDYISPYRLYIDHLNVFD
jgi:hypothetical protein